MRLGTFHFIVAVAVQSELSLFVQCANDNSHDEDNQHGLSKLDNLDDDLLLEALSAAAPSSKSSSLRGQNHASSIPQLFSRNLRSRRDNKQQMQISAKRNAYYDSEEQFYDEVVKARLDFKNGGFGVPQSHWPILDNTTCIDNEHSDPDVELFLHRAPYFLILGAMKAGTSTMNSYLKEHSLVVTKTQSKEFHFFDIRYTKNGFDTTGVGGIDKNRVQKFLQVQILNRWLRRPIEFEEDPDLITFDDSPRYLFWSDRIPGRVMCVTPWVKLIAIVREPVSRAFSHYNMELKGSYKHGGPNEEEISFADWVNNDMDDLIRMGVLQDEIPLEEFIGSKQQEDAWKAYTRLGTHAPVGRGLYIFQLNQWFKEMDRVGKSRDDLHVVNSEKFKADPSGTYKDVLEFLELPDEPLKNTTSKNTGSYLVELPDDLRQALKELYAPYNQVLYKLLGTEWDGVWEQ